MHKCIILFLLLQTCWSLSYANSQKDSLISIRMEKSFKEGKIKECIELGLIEIHCAQIENDSTRLKNSYLILSVLYTVQKLGNYSKICFSKYQNLPGRGNCHIKQLGVNHQSYNDNVLKKGTENLLNYPGHLGLGKLFLQWFSIDSLIQQNGTITDSQLTKFSGDWFGYADVLFHVGEKYIDSISLEKGIPYIIKAELIYQKLRIYNRNWLYCQQRLFSYLKKNNNLDESEKRFEALNTKFKDGMISKEYHYLYYIIKGYYFYIEMKLMESISAFEQAKKYSKISKRELFNINYWLIIRYFSIMDYKKVVELSQNFKYESDEVNLIILHSKLKIGIDVTSEMGYLDQYIKSDKYKSVYSPNFYYRLYEFYMLFGEINKAEKALKIYFNIVSKKFGINTVISADALSWLGYISWIYKINITEALKYYHRELYSLLHKPYNSDYFYSPDIEGAADYSRLAISLRNIAEAFFELSKTQKSKHETIKYLETSLSYYKLAVESVTRYKSIKLREDQKLMYSELVNHYYPFIIDVCLALYEKTSNINYIHQAFDYSEKSKATVLLSMSRGAVARSSALIPEKYRSKEERLSVQSNEYLHRLSLENAKSIPDYKQLDEIQTNLELLQQQHRQLIDVYKKDYPAYYNACYGNDVMTVNSLQKILTAKQVVLQYLLGKKMLLVFAITKDTFEMYKDTAVSKLQATLLRYREKVTMFQPDQTRDTAIRSFENLSNSLYIKLVSPFEKLIATKEIIVLPDGALNVIPFETLVYQKNDNNSNINYRKLNYLIKRNAVSYNYSASLIGLTQKNGESIYPSARLLAVAPSDMKYPSEGLANSAIQVNYKDTGYIVSIPGSENEVRSINKLFGGKLLLNTKATETNFKKYAGNFDILHLSSHGIANETNPLLSKILFSPEKDTLNDGMLNSYEVYSMHIKAPLVVLSACNTGYGKLYKGEGMVSLARGFFMSGSQNVVMTLWAVADKTSNKLMQNFYKHLSEKQTIGFAMQNAKTDYLSNADEMTAHPYFWAGYISVGNPEISFQNSNKEKNRGVLYSLSGLILVYLMLYLRTKRKNRCRRKLT